MNSSLSIRLDREFIQEIKANAHTLHMSQTEYIREAIERLNEEVDEERRAQRLINASLRVRDESMRVNAEFSEIEYDPED